MATGEFRLDAARVVSPVTPNKNGSAVELGEFKTNNGAILHDPVEIVTGTVAWRPERLERHFFLRACADSCGLMHPLAAGKAGRAAAEGPEDAQQAGPGPLPAAALPLLGLDERPPSRRNVPRCAAL